MSFIHPAGDLSFCITVHVNHHAMHRLYLSEYKPWDDDRVRSEAQSFIECCEELKKINEADGE
jgi:hypothetical protein